MSDEPRSPIVVPAPLEDIRRAPWDLSDAARRSYVEALEERVAALEGVLSCLKAELDVE